LFVVFQQWKIWSRTLWLFFEEIWSSFTEDQHKSCTAQLWTECNF